MGLGMLTALRRPGGLPGLEVKSGSVALKSEGKLTFVKAQSSIHLLCNPEEEVVHEPSLRVSLGALS